MMALGARLARAHDRAEELWDLEIEAALKAEEDSDPFLDELQQVVAIEEAFLRDEMESAMVMSSIDDRCLDCGLLFHVCQCQDRCLLVPVVEEEGISIDGEELSGGEGSNCSIADAMGAEDFSNREPAQSAGLARDAAFAA